MTVDAVGVGVLTGTGTPGEATGLGVGTGAGAAVIGLKDMGDAISLQISGQENREERRGCECE